MQVWECEERCGECGEEWRKVWGSVLGCGRGEERCGERHGDVGRGAGSVEKDVGKCVRVWERRRKAWGGMWVWGKCGGVWENVEKVVGKCVGVWGKLRDMWREV